MFSSKFSAVAVAAALSLVASSVAEVIEGSSSPATYVSGGNSNLAMYWVSVKGISVRKMANSMGREVVPMNRHCRLSAMNRLLILFPLDS
jgi:hypothetical protein